MKKILFILLGLIKILSADFTYNAKISKKDHYSSKGFEIKKVEFIIQQDRANYHKFNKRDDEDEYDPLFNKKRYRSQIAKMIERGGGISKEVRHSILTKEPLLKITYIKNGNLLKIKLKEKFFKKVDKLQGFFQINSNSIELIPLKEKPDSSSKSIGFIPYNGRYIEIKKCIDVNGKQWCKLGYPYNNFDAWIDKKI